MKYLLLILLVLVLAYLLYLGARFYTTVQTSKKLVETAVPFQIQSADTAVAVLVVGDSTAVGVGSDSSEETVAAKVGKYLSATSLENYAKSGAVTADLPDQIKKAKHTSYSLVLVQIGGNDIIRFKSAESAAAELETALTALPQAEKVIVISAGNVGGATIFPWFIRPAYTKLNKQYHAEFARVAVEHGAVYVNLYEDPGTRLIESQPEIYLSADGLHPSAAGYALWFEAIRKVLP